MANVWEAQLDAITASQTATTGGRKFDGNKLEYGLIPPLAQQEMVRVLTSRFQTQIL
jgi:hypothetical protein